MAVGPGSLPHPLFPLEKSQHFDTLGVTMPRVSVIIPTYNRAAWVAEAVASVLGQTCRDFELIVVDDGSRDATLEALGPFMARLLYLRRESCGGVSAARNLGAAAARGEWLAFLDSDDLWLPSKLAWQAAVLEALPTVALIGAVTLIVLFLTEITTFVGLVPMMFERAMFARFMIPLAISLAFGVVFAYWKRPVSVTSATYSPSAISGVSATPSSRKTSASTSPVEEASGTTRFTSPKRGLSWW